MHGSTAVLRPRQRTFTSCTECRRRKQRCNQAKDRPCNNCSRRYPPVMCTYESSSPPPTHDRIVDLRDGNSAAAREEAQQMGGRTNDVLNTTTAYQQVSRPTLAVIPTTISTGSNYYDSYGYCSTPSTTRVDYQGGTSSAQNIATTGVGDFLQLNEGNYQSDQMTYGVAQGQDYYANSNPQQGSWLSAIGDPGAFVGDGVGDYFYVCDPEPEHPKTSRG